MIRKLVEWRRTASEPRQYPVATLGKLRGLDAKFTRFCTQSGRLGVAERWQQRTALVDLLGVSWEKIRVPAL